MAKKNSIVDESKRWRRRKRGFWEAYQEFRQKVDLSALSIEPEEVFADVRDPLPGRDFDQGLFEIEDRRQ